MTKVAIEVSNLTHVFPNGRGIQSVSFKVHAGEVLGYLGPNGAGKTTTMRHVTGLMRAQSGSCTVMDHDAWGEAPAAHAILGYLPGELNLMKGSTGKTLLDLLAGMRQLATRQYEESLTQDFQVDLTTPVHQLSKGMKQKLGLVMAFQHDPPVMVLDEPTSGFDPLLQERFVNWIASERERGKAILLSSHMVQEVERTADRVVVIKEGTVVAEADIASLHAAQLHHYRITLGTGEEASRLVSRMPEAQAKGRSVTIRVQGAVSPLVQALQGLDVLSWEEVHSDLEQAFFALYEGGDSR